MAIKVVNVLKGKYRNTYQVFLSSQFPFNCHKIPVVHQQLDRHGHYNRQVLNWQDEHLVIWFLMSMRLFI